MKIAIAFFGLPRCSRVTLPTIEQQIFQHLPKNAEVKFFYHFYQQTELVNAHSKECGLLDQSNYEPFSSFEGMLERPEDILSELNLDEFKRFGSAWKGDDFTNLKNLLLQLRSLNKVTGLVKEFNPDCVLFLRPDLFYHGPIQEFYYHACMAKNDSIFLPEWQWGIGMNDRFALAGKDAYQTYGHRLNEAMNYCMEGNRPLHSERMLKYALLKHKKEVFILDAKATRIRINGDYAPEKFGTNISFFSPISNPHKRFLFMTQLKTKWLLRSFKKDL